MKKDLITSAVVAGMAALAIAGFQTMNKASAAPAEKVSICHATGSAGNPFVLLSTKALGEFGATGHTDANGTQLSGHEQDFFPEEGCDCEGNPTD